MSFSSWLFNDAAVYPNDAARVDKVPEEAAVGSLRHSPGTSRDGLR
jgi:hypothetical protein